MSLKMPVILIDNGHGKNTPGKRSPDERLREWSWTREIAAGIVAELQRRGHTSFLLTKDEEDVPLSTRAANANAYCRHYGTSNVLLISIHGNAAGNGKWMNAQGWSAFTTKGVTESDELALYLYKAAEKAFPGRKIRRYNGAKEPDWEENFTILFKSWCPAVLTENFFYDNKDDCEYMLSDEGKQAIIRCHVEGIEAYLENGFNQ